jgi:site-specific DNA-cytosine methylase
LLTVFTRTTAYGGKAKVPGDPDLLVAGFSCVDFSALNNKRKDLDDLGESGQTFQGILRYIKRHRPPIIILENVRNAPWSEIETHFNDIKYHFRVKKVDTKSFYLPQTRERGYAICVDGTLSDICNQVSFAQEMLGNWSDIFGKLGEQASAPFTKFILEDDDPLLDMVEKEAAQRSNSNRSTMGWEMYQIRHELHRRQHKLGEGRPLTHFQDNGTCSMPPFVRQEWVKQQPERVWDTLDINYLRSLRNYDINYKS